MPMIADEEIRARFAVRGKECVTMLDVTTGWSIELDRGPDCLMIRLEPEVDGCPDATGLAAVLDELLRLQFAHRIVIDLRKVPHVSHTLVDELRQLYRLVSARGGLMRVFGVNATSASKLDELHVAAYLPTYATLEDAMHGLCPVGKPK